jgi:hypothetical protein
MIDSYYAHMTTINKDTIIATSGYLQLSFSNHFSFFDGYPGARITTLQCEFGLFLFVGRVDRNIHKYNRFIDYPKIKGTML